ncbi:uncharacterized protein LOC131632982 [Vicia villosa]|uniref:uncharacterized protein LOC131632982 n=1 Tax=Vicia villosa TaxID=3911 RepID=UPI00273B988F|nr:uncharacterized protein LOC131632982 [Vicia villosa]
MSTPNLEDLSLHEEVDDEGFCFEVDEEGDEVGGLRWCLVGRFLCDRPIHLNSMKARVADMWRPVKGVSIKKAKEGLFLFQFDHKLDMESAINGGPWSFDGHLLIIERMQLGVQLDSIPLFFVDFWVQVHNLPAGLMLERVGTTIANFIGVFVEYDKNNNSSFWRQYMRLRVKIDVRKPLKKQTRVKNKGGEWCTVSFKYEKLGLFCFVCGILGHSEQKCEVRFAMPEDTGVRLWSSEIRAELRRGGSGPVSRWLKKDSGSCSSSMASTEENQARDSHSPGLESNRVLPQVGDPLSLTVRDSAIPVSILNHQNNGQSLSHQDRIFHPFIEGTNSDFSINPAIKFPTDSIFQGKGVSQNPLMSRFFQAESDLALISTKPPLKEHLTGPLGAFTATHSGQLKSGTTLEFSSPDTPIPITFSAETVKQPSLIPMQPVVTMKPELPKRVTSVNNKNPAHLTPKGHRFKPKNSQPKQPKTGDPKPNTIASTLNQYQPSISQHLGINCLEQQQKLQHDPQENIRDSSEEQMERKRRRESVSGSGSVESITSQHFLSARPGSQDCRDS